WLASSPSRAARARPYPPSPPSTRPTPRGSRPASSRTRASSSTDWRRLRNGAPTPRPSPRRSSSAGAPLGGEVFVFFETEPGQAAAGGGPAGGVRGDPADEGAARRG